MRYIIITLIIICTELMIPHSLLCQVNTEIMRKTDLTDGLYNNLTFSLGFIDGNSEILSIKSAYRADYYKNRHYAFLIANYQRAKSGDKVTLNKGFVHLRYSYPLNRFLKSEIFTQKEFNEFILIKDRQLFGGGLRFELLKTDTSGGKKNHLSVNVGNGLMHENEKFNKSEIRNTKIIRSTNYISSKIQLFEKITWIGIGYYQVNLKKTSDYRILIESGLGFNITKNFMITMNVNFRYDNEPPADIRKYDIDLTNGVSFNF